VVELFVEDEYRADVELVAVQVVGSAAPAEARALLEEQDLLPAPDPMMTASYMRALLASG
jgi:hypothetical protein